MIEAGWESNSIIGSVYFWFSCLDNSFIWGTNYYWG